MSCTSAEGTFKRHLFTIRENGLVRFRHDHCLRCGAPRKPPPPEKQLRRRSSSA